MIHLLLISRNAGRDRQSPFDRIHSSSLLLVVGDGGEGPVILHECPCMMRLGNKIHLSGFFPQMASNSTVIFRLYMQNLNLTNTLFFNCVYIMLSINQIQI